MEVKITSNVPKNNLKFFFLTTPPLGNHIFIISNMMKISDLKQEFQATQLLSINELIFINGGQNRDDKRRQRPGGGTTTTSPNLRDGGSKNNRKQFAVYQNYEVATTRCEEL